MARFRARMDASSPGWEMAFVLERIHLYYFTGTLQDGMLIIPRNGEAVFWIKRSYERALVESNFPCIRKMESYRDAAKETKVPRTVYLETGSLTLAQLQRLQKYFSFTEVLSADTQIAHVRSVKSAYELSLMEEAGRIHRHVLEDCVSSILHEGMDEIELNSDLYSLMVREGHQGMMRFGLFNEMLLGQVCFGTSSISPTCVNTPGGILGMHPSVPLMGSRERKLAKGDLVFIDIACGHKGYHTDKTQTYMFGKPLPDAAIEAHFRCVDIQDEIASLLKPGAIPSKIYNHIIDGIDPAFCPGFMGFGDNQVNFLGHGIGLWVAETPVIARGFDDPLEEGMVFAIEPKKGIPDVGLVGVENTFIVTPQGGRSITGSHRGLMSVY